MKAELRALADKALGCEPVIIRVVRVWREVGCQRASPSLKGQRESGVGQRGGNGARGVVEGWAAESAG